ncbi:MAG: hypothetical protein R2862_04645 [Thermoanaerobaculia bacterium]
MNSSASLFAFGLQDRQELDQAHPDADPDGATERVVNESDSTTSGLIT